MLAACDSPRATLIFKHQWSRWELIFFFFFLACENDEVGCSHFFVGFSAFPSQVKTGWRIEIIALFAQLIHCWCTGTEAEVQGRMSTLGALSQLGLFLISSMLRWCQCFLLTTRIKDDAAKIQPRTERNDHCPCCRHTQLTLIPSPALWWSNPPLKVGEARRG